MYNGGGPPTGPAAQGGGGYGQYQQQQQGGYQQQQGGYQQQQGPPHWQQQQQQQPQQGFQQHPRHVGLGAPGAAANLPPPQNLNRYVPQANAFPGVVPSQAWNGEKFSLFVGSLADGLEDGWLERILGAAGTVLSLRRPTPAFAFVEYGDPESVLRCLEVVNGTMLTGKGGVQKAMLVKADEKTRARLDTYEASRVKNDQTTEFVHRAQDDLAGITKLMASGSAPATSTLSSSSSAPPLNMSGRPERGNAHLQDLAPEDLPEDSRVVITSEIALFRESAQRRAKEKEDANLAAEARRMGNMRSGSSGVPSGPSGMGGGAYRPQGNVNMNGNQGGWGTRGGMQDPQSYNQPIGFVSPGGAAAVKTEDGAPPVVLDDAQVERNRAERAHRDREAAFRDRERRYEAKERARVSGVERERERERQQVEGEERLAATTRERLAAWDDEKEAEKKRDLYYIDRVRWRAQRRPVRAQEMERDARDRNAEATQLANAAREAEEFLARQAEEFAAMTAKSLEGGLRLANGGEDDAAVKLSFNPSTTATKPVAVRGVMGVLQEEEESVKKRELIPLSYSDDEDDAGGRKKKESTRPNRRMTDRERERKTKDVTASVPSTKEGLWAFKMPWVELSDTIISETLSPFATTLIVEYLGGEEEEILQAVIDHVRAHKSASALVDELEPVLDEEATVLVQRFWERLAITLALAQAGISP